LPDTTHPALVRRQGFRSTYGLFEPSDTKTVISSSNGAVSAGFHILSNFCFAPAAMGIHLYSAFRQYSLHGNLSSPLSFPRADHRRAVRVLDLEPIPRGARPVGRAQPLRHDALQAHPACLLEDRSAVRLPRSLASRFLRSPRGRPRRSSPSSLVAAIAAFAEAPAVQQWLACRRFQRGCAVNEEPLFEVDGCNLLTVLQGQGNSALQNSEKARQFDAS
jgi:hypothetical protein